MSGNQRDSVLVIKAKDEAQSTIKAIDKSLTDLLNSFRSGGNDAGNFAKGMAALDGALTKLNGQADSAEAAFTRVNAAIGSKRGDLQNLTAQILSARDALAKLNSADTVVSAGRDQSGRLQQVKAVEASIASLEKQQSRLTTEIAKMEAGIQGGASSLQVMGSAANGLEAKIAGARAEIDATTRSLAAQAAQARAAGEVLGRVNTTTGVSSAPATQSGAGFEALAEREIALQKQRETAARDATAAVKASVEANTGVARPAAKDSGATFSALNARGEAADLKAAADAHKAFEDRVRQGVAAMRDEAVTLKNLRDTLDPLAAIERELAAEQGKLNAMFAAGKISATELAGGMKILEQHADRLRKKPQIELFGLKPHETQNLLYQVNDVFTQLGSGASLMQALAQQGGQIIQLFPRITGAIAGAFTSPPIIAFGAALGTVVLALVRVNEEAARLRTFQGVLDGSASGANYQASALTAATKGLEQYGLSAEKAIATVRVFQASGLPQDRLEQFGRTAKDLADVLGIDVVDAAKRLADGFDGTYDGVKRLDDGTNLLTASERERARTLFAQGKAQEAMKVAYDAMAARLEKGAQDMRGPWSDATLALHNAWGSFLDLLGNSTAITNMSEALTDLANGVTRTLNSLSGVKSIRDIDAQIAELQRRIDTVNSSPLYPLGGEAGRALRDTQVNEAIAQIKELQAQREKLLAQQKASGGTSAGSGGSGTGHTDGSAGFGEHPKDVKAAPAEVQRMNAERELQDLREKGQRAVDGLRLRNESFLTAAQRRRREELAAELVDVTKIADKQVAAAMKEKAIRDERDRIMAEQDSYNTAANSPAMVARNFIADRESFRSQAYWDRNHFRVGFGSDTVTRADGSVSSTQKGTSVTMEDAVRDLDRRIKEFQDAIKTSIGADRFTKFSAEQQAALTSVAYNYGKLPERIMDAVRHGSSAQISAAIRGLGNDNGGINRARRNLEASTFTTSNVALEADTKKQADDLAADQKKFNGTIDDGNAKLALRTKQLNEQAGLTGKMLLDAQAQAAADQAELALRERFQQQNDARAAQNKSPLDLPQAQIDATRQTASDAVRTNQRNAEAARDDVMRPVTDLSAKRDATQQQLELQKAQGDGAAVKQLRDSLNVINGQLREAVTAAQQFFAAPENAGLLESLGLTAAQIENIQMGLENAKIGTQQWVTIMGISGQTIAQNFSSGATNGIDKFAKSVASGANAFRSLGDAARQFTADFLIQIAQMIEQQEIFNLISGLLKGVGGGLGGAAGGAASSGSSWLAPVSGATVAHSGGIIGSTANVSRSTPSAWFANAARYHVGGIAGLSPGEVPAVLMRGEEVLTRDDPRHILNGGGAGGGGGAATPQNIKIVNAIDSGHMLSEAMNTDKGQKSIVNFIRQNSRAVNSALGK